MKPLIVTYLIFVVDNSGAKDSKNDVSIANTILLLVMMMMMILMKMVVLMIKDLDDRSIVCLSVRSVDNKDGHCIPTASLTRLGNTY